MDLPADLLSRPPAEAARLIARAQLRDLLASAERLADPGDVEALHDARVALRRLRSTLRTWKAPLAGAVKRKQREALAGLQEASGAGRDAEVGAEWLDQASERLPGGHRRGAAWLAARLRREAKEARGAVRADFTKVLGRLAPRLERRLSTYPAPVGAAHGHPGEVFATAAAAALRAQRRRLERALEAVTGPERAAEAHAARIQGKRLRYLLEPLAVLLPGADVTLRRLKVLQDLLGGIQDLVVLGATVDSAVEQAAVEHVRRQAEAARHGGGAAARDVVRPGLLALARTVEGQRSERFAALLGGWREGGADLGAFTQGLEGLVEAARAAAHGPLEIERKYLLRGVPDPLPPGDVLEVEQGWLPGTQLMERLRRTRRGDALQHVRTVKLGRGLTRLEIEEPTDAALFEALWPLTQGCRVTKRRHRIPDGDRVWEIDVFLDRDLVLAEVELPSADAEAPPPAWLAPWLVREVTEEDGYVNRNLAR